MVEHPAVNGRVVGSNPTSGVFLDSRRIWLWNVLEFEADFQVLTFQK